MVGMEVSELVRLLLGRRGVTEPDAIEKFLTPDFGRDTHDPFLLHDMERAVSRVFAAIVQDEKIAIYADFDCDGIPGAAVLHDFFKKIGHSNFEIYIPHRDREGYGFHIKAIEELAKRGASLIITVDVGTTAIAAVKRAKALGIDVIVTDHHEIKDVLPDAIAVVNPKLGDYPFRDPCGAAVAWKLVQALVREGKRLKYPVFEALPEGWEKWLLDLVAIATVADLVPLVGENRALTHFGLKVLRKSPRLGIQALCSRARLRQSDITEETIAFSFAPRINAASRMDEPEVAFSLLTTADEEESEHCAAHLERLNVKRRGVVGALVREAKRRIKIRFNERDRLVVLGDTEWKPALMGLAANSIMEERGGVVCMWGRDAIGRLKGSCRSDGSVSIVDLFSNAREAFEEFGGHAKSGGFTVSRESVHTLHDVLLDTLQNMQTEEADQESGDHDAQIELSEFGFPLLEEVSRLAPFGIGNPKPVFLVSGVSVSSVRRFGREGNHIEVFVSCERTGARARAFNFFRVLEDFTYAPAVGSSARILATVEHDTFRRDLALRLVDVLSP